mgnify:CR=1 FL=1
MKIKINKTIQFIHPDFDHLDYGNGIQTQPNGKISMVSDGESIRQSILILISTIPGERVMRPKYGCNLHQLAFMPNDATTHGLAIHYVKTAIEQWEPRIDIIYLDADINVDNPCVIDITLQYLIQHLHHNDQLTLSYQLMGAEN